MGSARDHDRDVASVVRMATTGSPPTTPTTVGEQLLWAWRALAAVGVSASPVEAATLLAWATGARDLSLNADPDDLVTAAAVDRFLASVARRARGETIGAITGFHAGIPLEEATRDANGRPIHG